jgi:threonine/homoserine/homoserine lactone efflux protein
LLVVPLETSQSIFLLEVLGMLAVPGPTNSLLFVSGVTRGFGRSLRLILAEVTAYLISLSFLLLVLQPLTKGHSTVTQLLRVVCSMYLAYVAVGLWRSGTQDIDESHPITFLRVFLTTLVNPKNLIFAFGIFPASPTDAYGILPYLGSFSAICTAVGCGWIAGGALLHATAAHKAHFTWFYRGEACMLVGFALVILISAYYAF